MPGSETLAPQRLQNKAGAASQGPAQTIPALSPRPQPQPSLRLVPSPRQLAWQPPLSGRQPRLGRHLGQAMGSSNNPSQGLDAGLTEATLGPPPSTGWPGCLGQPVGDAGLARPVTGEGSPAGLVRRRQPTPCPRTSCSPGQHQEPPTGAGGPYPPPRPSMGPGRCWPACVRCCNRPSGPHRGRGGAWGSEPPER